VSAKHTPGEWVFEFKDDHTVIRSMEECYRPGAGYVCHVNKNNVSEAEREANENLIAAAPDLLEALHRMADAYVALLLIKGEDPASYRSPIMPYGKALAAIAKATGETK
jgi:hypothetical protein